MNKTKFARSHGWRPVLLVVAGAVICVLCFSMKAWAVTPGTNTSVIAPAQSVSSLDAKRLFALGMIETGNNDREVGAAGEVSRYQIHPAVWKVYSPSMEYTNPDISLQVARQHWAYLAQYFREKAGREPEDFDMYVLWNTKHGYYARKGFSQLQISPVVQDRAQRFVNLVNRKN
jgi:hypothetical protein